ncbi:MAG: DUF5615 family PIN-like protein [Acidobacteriota bacterium]
MKVRFQADSDLKRGILLAVDRLEPRVDFRSATDAGLDGVKDPDVLARTARDGRILVTHDRKTMPRHFGTFVTRQSSPGVLVVPQKVPIALAAEELVLIWSVTEAEEWIDRICGLPL